MYAHDASEFFKQGGEVDMLEFIAGYGLVIVFYLVLIVTAIVVSIHNPKKDFKPLLDNFLGKYSE